MNYVGKIFTWGKDLYKDLNTATLTGAIDVIVVEQADGTLRCSPFHVRFGKLGVLRSKEKEVDIFVNNEPVELGMKLGDSGVAYFVDEEDCRTASGSDVANACAEGRSSPSLGSAASLSELHDEVASGGDTNIVSSHSRQTISSTESEVSFKSFAAIGASPEGRADGGTADGDSLSKVRQSPDLAESPILLEGTAKNNDNVYPRPPPVDFGPRSLTRAFSDSDLTPPLHHSPSTCEEQMGALSDTELSCPNQHLATAHSQLSWTWGNLPAVDSVASPEHSDEEDHRQAAVEIVNGAAGPGQGQSAEVPDNGQGSFFGSVMERIWPKGQSHHEDGDIYLSELNLEDMGPELAARYLGRQQRLPGDLCPALPDSDKKVLSETTPDALNVVDSGSASLPDSSPCSKGVEELIALPQSDDIEQSISATAGPCSELQQLFQPGSIELSLCGNLKDASGDKAPEKFNDYIVSFEAFCEKPELITSPHLIVRVGKKYYSWQVAAPIILSILVFQRPLPEKPLHSLMKHHMPKRRRFAWFSWRTSDHNEQRHTDGDRDSMQSVSESSDAVGKGMDSPPAKDWRRTGGFSSDDDIAGDELAASGDEGALVNQGEHSLAGSKRSSAFGVLSVDPWQQTLAEARGEGRRGKRRLRLSSDELCQLRLQPGPNTISFSVTTKYQGTTVTTAMIYLWNHSDKLVVSDVDGTITKSDVYGHILPWFGNDWAQTGVAELFTAIEHNGYRFVYLSARAIGQARLTRHYLRSIKQGRLSLPEGPVLLNPSSLIHAFHREVILKKPEEFKIAALRDIATVFGSISPYYAGFGNRPTDVLTYCTLGIPRSRIFTVNPTGVLTHDLMNTFRSSYKDLHELADHFFPAKTDATSPTTPEAYRSFNFWRAPMPDIGDLDDLA